MDAAEKQRHDHRHDKTDDGTGICRNFNCGRCTYDGKGHNSGTGKRECNYAHLCWQCHDPSCNGACQCKKTGSAVKRGPQGANAKAPPGGNAGGKKPRR